MDSVEPDQNEEVHFGVSDEVNTGVNSFITVCVCLE